MKIDLAFDNFIKSRIAKGLVQKSIRNYREFISPFITFCGHCDIESLTDSIIQEYIISLYDNDIRIATIATHVTHIKAFLHWCNESYNVSFSYKKLIIPKVNKKTVYIYNPDEIKQIFSKASGASPWIQKRNICIIALMLDSGLRQSEVVGLKKSDIDYYLKTIRVLGKGNKERKVPLGEVTERFINSYLNICPYSSEFLFLDKLGNPLTANAVKKFVQKMKAELPFDFGSHKLRHNFATNYCLDEYEANGMMDAYGLMAILGHEDISTTNRYIHEASEIIACKKRISHLDKIGFA